MKNSRNVPKWWNTLIWRSIVIGISTCALIELVVTINRSFLDSTLPIWLVRTAVWIGGVPLAAFVIFIWVATLLEKRDTSELVGENSTFLFLVTAVGICAGVGIWKPGFTWFTLWAGTILWFITALAVLWIFFEERKNSFPLG